MMDLTMRAKLLPAPYIIKNFVGGEDNCNYEIYLLELLNSSAWFSAHYPGGFTKPSSESHGECDAINQIYQIDFKLLASKTALQARRDVYKRQVPGDLSFVLPHRHLTSIVESLKAFDKLAPGLYSKNTLLYGVEVKFYSSKIQVDDRFETKVKNLFAIGDGAGITRGLMQASVTGVAVARNIARDASK